MRGQNEKKYIQVSGEILAALLENTIGNDEPYRAALWHHLTPTMSFLSSSTRVVTVLINQCKKIVFEISWIYWKSCNKLCFYKHIKNIRHLSLFGILYGIVLMFYKIIHADLISDHLRIFEYSYHRYQIYKISVVFVVPQRKFHAMKHFTYLSQGLYIWNM